MIVLGPVRCQGCGRRVAYASEWPRVDPFVLRRLDDDEFWLTMEKTARCWRNADGKPHVCPGKVD